MDDKKIFDSEEQMLEEMDDNVEQISLYNALTWNGISLCFLYPQYTVWFMIGCVLMALHGALYIHNLGTFSREDYAVWKREGSRKIRWLSVFSLFFQPMMYMALRVFL